MNSSSNKEKCPYCGSDKGFEPGIVLDPFAGSFTTALVAEKLGRNWIGIDLSEDYCRLGQARIYKWRKENKGGLFNEPPSPPPIIKGF